MRFLILISAALLFTAPALAQETEAAEETATMPSSVKDCGTPADVTVAPDAGSYCDIYARRMAYAEKRKKLRDSIDARRENFQEPQNAAISAYNDSISEQHGTEEGSAEFEDGGFDTEGSEDDLAITEQDDTAILE
jgi:hypothetical protein